MWYFILGAFLAAYVGWDAWRRGNNYWAWALVAIPAWPASLPLYRAKRFLLAGEKRVGGTAWLLIKWFVLCWQLLCVAWLISYFVALSKIETHGEYEEAGAAVGGLMGTGLIVGFWAAVTVIGFVVGLLTKKDTVEEGPTGPKSQVPQ